MWIKKRFFDKKSEDILAITRNYYHNEFLSPSDIKMFEELRERDPEAYRIAGEGEWGIAGGGYFREFSRAVHVCAPFDVSDNNLYNRYAAFDYGLDMFACLFFAADRYGRVYVYREICRKDTIVSDAANMLYPYIAREKIISVYAPPDMWSRQRESGKSIADIFAACGIPLVRAANNRVNGWLCVKEQMKIFYENKAPRSGLMIFDTCENLIDSIPRLMKDEKNPSDISLYPHEITHAPDALRYFLGSAFSLPESRREEKDPALFFEKDESGAEIDGGYIEEFFRY